MSGTTSPFQTRRRGEQTPGFVTDAAGRRVRVLDPGVDWLLNSDDRFDRPTLERVAQEVGIEARAGRRLIIGGVCVVLGLTLVAGIAIAVDIMIEGPGALRDLVGSLFLTGPGVAVMLGVGVITPIVVARRRRLACARQALLRCGHCPHCGYRIDGLPPDPEMGWIRCPECACAWEQEAGGGATS